MTSQLRIGLSTVIVAIDNGVPSFLATRRGEAISALPFGTFDPENDRTFELALRGWVRKQTGFELGYVEQLYTFGDRDREAPEASLSDISESARIISVGYLALTAEAATVDPAFDARWRPWYRYFPWEDHRKGRPAIIDAEIVPHLKTWAIGNEARYDRARLAFAFDGANWIEERVLERYELLYEAGLVEECARDAGLTPGPGSARLGKVMASDHRRILATAISRLRGKIKYRPVIFELMPEQFTLSALQGVVEEVLGLLLHKQNFRRALNKACLVEGTGIMETRTGGRPAKLYKFRRKALRGKMMLGVATPNLKREQD